MAQPRVSDLMRGTIGFFTIDALVDMLVDMLVHARARVTVSVASAA